MDALECTRCGVGMERHEGAGRVQYFRCHRCRRWVSSIYAEVLRADAGFRRVTKEAAPQGPDPLEADSPPAERTPMAHPQGFAQVKDRLERWLAALEDQDPYRLLGVSPLDSDEVVRARFRELALTHHPDRGGSLDKMRELNLAYEQIQRHREARQRERLVVSEEPVPLPARSR